MKLTLSTLDVGMDLDGCNFWFESAYFTGCRALGRIEPEFVIAWTGMAQRYEFFLDLGHTRGDFVRNCHDLADLGMLWAGPMIPGSKTMWDTLLDDGHRIHVITDRSFGVHPIASEVGTRMWLAGHQRRYDSLMFSADKTIRRTDVMLEDKISNYDDLCTAGSVGVLINRPWNVVPGGDDRLRVDTYDEFLAIVADLAASRAEAQACGA